MRARTACVFVGGLLLTVACRPGREGSQAAAPPATVTAAAEPAAPPPPTAAPIVVKDAGFRTPESVLYDDESDVFLVSNINGPEVEADGNGFISRLDAEGKILDLKWIDGSKAKYSLDAPKGMAFAGPVLYVADITAVKTFDRKTGRALGKVTVPGASFLNDLSAAPDGSVYASDSGLKADKGGLEPDGRDAIYRITAEGKVERVIRDKALGNPNGLLADADGAWVVTFGSGELYRVTRGRKKENSQKLPTGQLDGIVRTSDGSLLISSWEGSSILRGTPDGTFTATITGVAAPADIAYDSKRGRLWIPLFTDDAIEIHSLASIPAPQR
jgi:sugar lactone lactonase YvrE